MALYSYKAINSLGKTVRGLQDAANEIDLEQSLKQLGLDLVYAKEGESVTSMFSTSKIKRIDLLNFFLNMEQLTAAGVPLLDALADLRDSLENQTFREILASMIEEIEGGKKLSQSMALHPNAFDKISISLIHAGEESGRLTEIFKHLTESLKWQDEMASHSKTIMIYPAVVGTVVLGVTFFLMIYLVPQLVSFIKNMGGELPLQTRILLAVSAFFTNYWYVILLTPVVLVVAYKLAVPHNPGLQYQVDKLKLTVWPIGPIVRKIILARFANTFAMMYASGITVLNCIANSRDLVNNRVIAASLEQIEMEIEAGRNLTQSFQKTEMFPPLVIRMLRVGEATGALDQALLNVSYFYDRDVKDSIKRVQVMIEPAMTLILGGLLGWVMISVLGPIYDLISKVKV
jgi:type IV pilus assembly protein PilC